MLKNGTLAACRTLGIEAKIWLGEGGFCRFCRAIVGSIAQKSGEICTVQTDLQPILLKSGRLLAFIVGLTLATPAAFAGFDEAAAAFAAGDFNKALNETRPLAEKGDPRSQYAMGVLYENGFAVPKDLKQAAVLYLKAAQQGNTDAQYNLGAMYEHGVGMSVNYAEAARWYRPAAEQGDIDALSNLGVLYGKGLGVPQDKVLAMALYNVSVAYAGKSKTQATQNRQSLANQMSLEDVKKALALTDALLKPGNLKAGLAHYLQGSR